MTNYRASKKSQTRRQRVLLLAMVVLCVLATLAYLRSRLWIIDLSYRYSQLARTMAQEEKRNAELRVEIARLRTPSRLERIAKEELGLKRRTAATPVVELSLAEGKGE